MKLLFLAIDGLDYDLIHRYKCEFLLWLMESNQHGVLISNDPSGCNQRGEPLTGCAWNTIYTGLPASGHGMTSYKFLRAGSVDYLVTAPSIWDILGRNYSLGLMTLAAYKPINRPLPPVNRWAINGFPCEGEVKGNHVYGLLEGELPGDFRIEEYTPSKVDLPTDFYALQKEQVDDKLDLAKELPGVEVMAIGIQMIDFVGHFKLDKEEEYKFIDDWIRRALSELGPDEFVVCSDHGFQLRQRLHSQTGVYIASLPGGEVPRTIFDIAPLTLFMLRRHHD